MNAYNLPTSIDVCGVEYPIRSDFRCVLDILTAASDPELNDWERQEVMTEILYEDSDGIPFSAYGEACKKAVEFIDFGVKSDSKPRHRLMDWEQDAQIIIPAINKVAGIEIRSVPYLHWWTFMGYFMEIGEGVFSQVVSIRQKKAKKKKLEKWEREFERENASLVNLKSKQSEEDKRAMMAIEKWL